MTSRYVPKSYSEYHDYLVSILLKSPNHFTSFDGKPVDQQEALRQAFETLQQAFPLVGKRLKDEYLASVLRELLRMAHEFFCVGDERNGKYALQEVEGTIWPSRRIPPRHAPEAESRAHGKLERYAGVIPNPYPYVGTLEDMGKEQLRLFKAVLNAYESGEETLIARAEHYWVLGTDAVVRRLAVRSRKAANARFVQELSAGTSIAALRATDVFGDMLILDVEEPGHTRISVRGKHDAFKTGNPNFIVEAPKWTDKTEV